MTEQIKPRFEVHKIEGQAKRRIASPKKDKEGTLLGGFDYADKEVDAGWMVYFPNGASIHVWTEDEMKRQGFLDKVHLVNMETGDDMGAASDTSLRARSEQKLKVSKNSKVHHVT
jgi:hypothetical protein|tara:strand:- start:6120 stop:6464 length:345 start_codon:yes stop_codon:yes gene_type:complete